MTIQKGLLIGKVAARTGVSVSAIRHYESEGLVHARRNSGGQRIFAASDIRRISFVIIAQNLGFSLAEIRAQLNSLPQGRTPTKSDWEKMSRNFNAHIEARINRLTTLREKLAGCIGCGCLSLRHCALYNPGDEAQKCGPGPRFLMGNSSKRNEVDDNI